MPLTLPEQVPVFDSLNATMFAVAVIVASGLSLHRWWQNGDSKRGSWISDATSAWSAMILALLALSSFTHKVPIPLAATFLIPSELELIKSNGLMVPFSFCYCSVMLLRNLFGEFEVLFQRFRRIVD